MEADVAFSESRQRFCGRLRLRPFFCSEGSSSCGNVKGGTSGGGAGLVYAKTDWCLHRPEQCVCDRKKSSVKRVLPCSRGVSFGEYSSLDVNVI